MRRLIHIKSVIPQNLKENVKVSPTRRHEYGVLLRLGLPVIVTQLGTITVGFVDTAMVGSYGTGELASAAFVNGFFMVPIVFILGFANGMTPLAGKLFGSSEMKKIGALFRCGLRFNLLIAVALTLLMGVLYFFIGHFGQPPELLPLIRSYYLVILGGIVPIALFACSQQVSNGVNDTASPMWVILASNVLNIIGNWVLIFGKFGAPELGLLGAGISTTFARLFSAAAMLMILCKRRKFSGIMSGFSDKETSRSFSSDVWVTSYPVAVQSSLECLLWSMGAVVCGWFGKIQLASFQIINTISQLGFMVYMSFGVATSVKVSNFIGEGKPRDAFRITIAGLHLNLILAAIASLVFFFGVPFLADLFTSDKEVIGSALTLVFPLVLYQFCDAIQLTFASALRGTSNVKPLLAVAAIAYVLAGIPALLGLSTGLGLGNIGVYYSFSVALFIAAWMLWHYFRKTIVRLKRVNEKGEFTVKQE